MSLGRKALTYLSMVGVPVVGIVLVLRAGRSLDAAPAVGGTWQLRARPQVTACYGIRDYAQAQVEQSGRYLDVVFDKVHGQGSLSNGRLVATLVAPGGTCRGKSLAVEGAIHSDRMTWSIGAKDGCEDCPSLALEALRREE